MATAHPQHVVRLTGADYSLGLTHGIGFRMPMQLIFLSKDKYDEAAVKEFNHTIASSSFSRQRVKSKLPFARDYWKTGTYIPPIHFEKDPIAAQDRGAWLDTQALTSLNTFEGGCWRLSAANIAEGGSVLSFLISHEITDGRGAITKTEKIAKEPHSGNIDPPISGNASITDDIKDIPRTLVEAFPYRLLEKAYKVLNFKKFYLKSRTGTFHYPAETRIFSLEDFSQAAKSRGGTITSLAVAIGTNLTVAISGKDVGAIAMPMDNKAAKAAKGKLISQEGQFNNDISNCKVELRPQEYPYTDLPQIRSACKEAYKHPKTPLTSPRNISMVSMAGLIEPQTSGLFPGTENVYGRAIGWVIKESLLPLMHNIMVFVTVYGDKIAITSVTGNLKNSTKNLSEEFEKEAARFDLKAIDVI